MENNTINTEQDIIDYLSILYGDNVKVLYNTYVFTWDKEIKPRKPGYILALNGSKLIKEKVDNVIDIIDNQSQETIGYAVFLKNQLKELYNIKATNTDKVLIISNNLRFERAKLQSKYYNKQRPDMVLTYNLKKYIGKFDTDNMLKYFISPS